MESKNPLILSVDTSAINCTVAISEGSTILVSYSICIKKLHDKLLAEFTNRALNDLSITFAKLDAVAISSGPGSFTGLRIGASFVKGLTVNNHPKFISLPTLQLFSIQSEIFAELSGKESIVSVISANSGMLYTQKFDLLSNPLSEPKFQHSSLLEIDKKSFYCGDGYKIIPELNNPLANQSIFPESLAKSAYRYYESNQFTNSESFEPEYIQDFVFKG